MAVERSQSQEHKHKLEQGIKPQMMKSLAILSAPNIELESMLRQEIMANPLLEIDEFNEDEPEDRTPANEDELSSDDTSNEQDDLLKKTLDDAKELSEVLDSWNDFHNEQTVSSGTNTDDEPQFEDFVCAEENYKLEYINSFDRYQLPDNEYDYVYDLIDNCNAYGFLPPDLDIYQLAKLYKITRYRADELHTIVLQAFPKGISARSINECLYHQLDENERKTIIADIILDDFDALINRKFDQIAFKYDVPEEIILECRDRIAQLDPKPGLRLNIGKPQYIVPDIIVIRVGDEFEVVVNDFHIPRIALSRKYQNILSQMGKDRDAVNYVRDKINSAKFLIRSVFMRNRTLERIMRSIIHHQRRFFYECSGCIDPLSYAVLANELNVNESTVSRVVKSKYADTPFGVLSLRDFFCASAIKEKGAEAVSKNSIVSQLKSMIDNEDKTQPLSDQDIVNIFNERGTKISRRAVTKYREEMNIENSRQRKK